MRGASWGVDQTSRLPDRGEVRAAMHIGII